MTLLCIFVYFNIDYFFPIKVREIVYWIIDSSSLLHYYNSINHIEHMKKNTLRKRLLSHRDSKHEAKLRDLHQVKLAFYLMYKRCTVEYRISWLNLKKRKNILLSIKI